MAAPVAPPFVPARARAVALALGAVSLAGAVVAGLIVLDGEDGSLTDALYFVLFGALVAWFCWRQASVRAVPTQDTLVVRNVVVTREVAWARIVGVRLMEGEPWVQLDLSDGDTLAVMGIQRADGRRGIDEARRLDRLVRERGEAPERPGA